jgi:hypothetical protein
MDRVTTKIGYLKFSRYYLHHPMYYYETLQFALTVHLSLISGFRRHVDEICALLGYYAASCGNCLPTFRDNV